MCKGTYSPKIREDLIPILYHLAKRKRVPMTRLVNEIIENYLHQIKDALREMEAREMAKCLLERRQNEKSKQAQKGDYG
jgi:predicted DNA-binding protein